jgi:hypothetical protein
MAAMVVAKTLHGVRAFVNAVQRRERVAMTIIQTSSGWHQRVADH